MKHSAVTCFSAILFLFFANAVHAKKQDYHPIKRAFIKQLPKPIRGWKATKVKAGVHNSPFQKSIFAGRVYRPRRAGGGDAQIGIYIGAKPGWKTSRYQKFLDDPKAATAAAIEVRNIGKQRVLIKRHKENYNAYVVVDKRILVTFAGKWVTAKQVKAYIVKVNYTKLAGIR